MSTQDTRLGAHVSEACTRFRVRAPAATGVDLCLFGPEGERRLAMARDGEDWTAELPGEHASLAYGYRASGTWAPERGLWFDPAKLLVDPYAIHLDRRFQQRPALAVPGEDTAAIVPRALVTAPLAEVPREAPRFTPGGLIYELHVRGFTLLHPDVPEARRGTVAALAHPSVIAHLRKLHVGAVELMPIVAWLDERHLPPLGLTNAWGYNPIAPMALDPGLCPGGMVELRETVAALHAAGIGVILDLVFNHSGESDVAGGVTGLRGLDPSAYALGPAGELVNDTGCGNTLDFGYPPMRELALASLRHFTRHAGVDGFRFDLAPVLARGGAWGGGFDAAAPFFAELAEDPWLADRVMIAEPWDIGPSGYRLGEFPANWLEWNDVFRDAARRFWNRDLPASTVPAGTLATRLAGSADIFGEQACRSINFLAAHDGFTLADTVAYQTRHNEANGEQNRDGHGANYSWNNGAEGPSDDPHVLARRAEDLRVLLGTLFVSAGTIMLTAGDEFGRGQQGNNNAYCQDNALSWIDWRGRDVALEDYVAGLAAWRAGVAGEGFAQFPRGGGWKRSEGGETAAAMAVADWEDPGLEGFAFLSADKARPQGFLIDRRGRRVIPQGGD